MILVAIAMVAIVAIAALSIDVVTLYLAREEAQRAADAAALTAARVISISGLTGDPANAGLSWQAICGGAASPATQAATAVAMQSTVGGAAATSVSVLYSAGASVPAADCSSLTGVAGGAFAVNPMVTVQLTRSSLPTFFSRMWGNTGNTVSATASAEAFNPSNSGNVGNQVIGSITPVQPRCVKPWVVPNYDPLNPGPQPGNKYCGLGGLGACQPLVNSTDGSITHKGISISGTGATGVIGERFLLIPACSGGTTGFCAPRGGGVQANHDPNAIIPTQPNLEYLPGQTLYASVAVPSLASGTSSYEQAVAGCDQTTVYHCGESSASLGASAYLVDMSKNPASTGDTTTGVLALIHEGDATDSQPDGQDVLSPYGAPSSYPFKIYPGTSNLLVGSGVSAGSPISSSPSIVSLPIYDPTTINSTGTTTPVTIVGFLQVFINAADPYGNVDVTILNVVGCGNGTNVTGTAVSGSSPVPVRLITPP